MMSIEKFLIKCRDIFQRISQGRNVKIGVFKIKAKKFLYDYHQAIAKDNVLIKRDFRDISKEFGSNFKPKCKSPV